MPTGSYNEGLATNLDKLRAMLGDTDMDAPLLGDDHLGAVLTLKGSITAAVVFCAEELIARFAAQPVRATSNGVTVDYSDRIAAWRALAASARADLAAAQSSSGVFTFVPARYSAAETDEYAQ